MPKETYFNLPDEKKARIRDTVYELFASYPYNKVTTRMITQKADIPMGSLYQYFESKDELFLYFQNLVFKEAIRSINKGTVFNLIDYTFSGGNEEIVDVLSSEIKRKFVDSLYFAPVTVLKKLFFDSDYNNLNGIMKEYLDKKIPEGKGINREKAEFALFMYNTLKFNYFMYLRKKGIESPEDIKRTNEELHDPLLYGPKSISSLIGEYMIDNDK